MSTLIERFVHYGPYVWGAYATVAICLAVEVTTLLVGRRRIRTTLEDARLVDELSLRERAEEVAS